MREIRISSFAKINFSIDVTGVREDGMHLVDMIMHQIDFHDDVCLRFYIDRQRPKGDIIIRLKTNRYYLPTDERNLAYKAAALLIDKFKETLPGGILTIDIHKRIPVAAGMAGGSGNGAAVLHGLNRLWNLGLSLSQLCEMGGTLGADVPFCLMGQAGMNSILPKKIKKDPLAASCARATGIGVELEPLPPVRKNLVIAKPSIAVSTKEVYQGIDRCFVEERPDNDAMTAALKRRDDHGFYAQCINVLECYTLEAYPEVKQLKELLLQDQRAEKVLMSGSGPTVFAVYSRDTEAKKACFTLREKGYEAYWTKTTR